MILLNPLMPDSVLVYDPNLAFIGTITRSVRTGRDMNQVEEMFKQRARLKGAMEAPVRRAMQPVADRRDAVSRLNKDLIAQASGEGSLSEQAQAARTAAIEKGITTRRANQWAQDIDDDAAAAALQPDCSDDAQAIPSDQIASWLED
jgi:hypothetical protein